jgi:transforming growth factor-beta-induced protein
LKPYQAVKTVEGKSLEVTRRGASVRVGGSLVSKDLKNVIKADNLASNGVVHIIDGVLLPPTRALENIVALAASTADLSTLVKAVTAGKLAAALSGTGPFTVFAPTNEAFAKLPKATLNHLLDPKNIKELDAILEYHVLSGVAVSKADLKSEQKVKTLEGQDVEIKATRGEVLVNQARVTTADVAASNGIVHIIDSVLMIPKPNIVQLAERTADLIILVSAVVAGDLADTLSSAGKFTVFAPTNEAFKALPAGTLDALMKPENKAKLVDILTYHVLPEQVLSTQLKPFQAVKTVEGKLLHVQEWGGKVHVGPSLLSKDLKNVVKADNVASNGVVHIIDGVLLPPSETIVV